MSAQPVIEAGTNTRPRSLTWAVAAVSAGLAVPWLVGWWLSTVGFSDLLTTFYIRWALIAVLVTFFEIGCTWVVAAKGPVSGDRATDLLLTLMVLAVAAFLFLTFIPYLGAQIETRDGAVLAPPVLDGGLITAIGYLGFGLSLSGVLGWRGFQRSEHVDRGSEPSVSRLVLALIVLVTIAAGYLAWATHTEQILRN